MTRRRTMAALSGTGDDGSTGLLGGGRAPKDDARIEAYGTVDEASSALGLARALCRSARVREVVEEVQRGCYRAGAELATHPGEEGKFAVMTPADVDRLEVLMDGLEAEVVMPSQFILPGATAGSGALDVARTVVRRAERRVVTLLNTGAVSNREIGRWLNRLSLLVFVLGRVEEAAAGVRAEPAKESPGPGS